MCDNLLSVGHPPVTIACGKCDACRQRKKLDFIGRCIAESKHARHTWFVTLTYGRRLDRDEPLRVGSQSGYDETPVGAVIPIYRHVQNYIKRLRAAGYALRFYCVTEKGTQKGRVHHHLLIWWQGDPPPHYAGMPIPAMKAMYAKRNWRWNLPEEEKLLYPRVVPEKKSNRGRKAHKPLRLDWDCDQDYWEHGWSNYKVADHGHVAYLAGYVHDGQSSRSAKRKEPKKPEDRVSGDGSTVPLIGGKHFKHLAKLHVQQGLSPQDGRYRFPDVLTRKGVPFDYWMGRSAKAFYVKWYLRFYKAHCRIVGEDKVEPASQFVIDELDRAFRLARARRPQEPWEADLEVERIKANSLLKQVRVALPPRVCPRTNRVMTEWDTRPPLAWNHKLMAWQYPPVPEPGVQTVYWGFDDDGLPAWSRTPRSEAWAARRRAELKNPAPDKAGAHEGRSTAF